MKVLFATPECAPLVKTGGLGDVSAALPAALFSQGVDVRLLLPGYPSVLAHVVDAPEVARFELFSSGHELSLLEGKLGGLPLYVLHCPSLFDRPGTP
jgi:starch synthase